MRAVGQPAPGRTHGPRATRLGSLLGVLLVAGLASGAGSALAAQSTVDTSVDTTRITVGDRVHLSVTVDHAAGAVVSWPDSVDMAPFELVDARIPPMRTRGDRAVSSARFTFTAFELGSLELPPLGFTVLHPDGREESLSTDAYGIEVVSVGVDESGDIREIRGPLAIPLGAWGVFLALVLLLFLAGAVWVVRRRLAHRDGDGTAVDAGPPPRPPHEVALEALSELESGSLLAEGRVKEFHIRVSEILRRYVEGRWRVPAREMTTWEVMDGLASSGLDDALRDDLRRFLIQCDMVKFAKADPGTEASLDVLRLGRSIVERSTVVVEDPMDGRVDGPAAEAGEVA